MFSYKTYRIHQFLGLVWIHTCRRLVQKQKLGIRGKGAGDLQLTLLAVGKVPGKLVRLFVQIEYLQDLHGSFVHFLFHFEILRQTENSGQCGVGMMVVQAHLNVIQNRHVLKKTDILESTGNPRLIDLNGAFSRDILAIQLNDPLVGLVYAGEKIEYGCFSRSVGADQAIELAFFNIYMKAVHRPKTAELNGQMIYFQHRHIKPPPFSYFRL